MTADANSRNAFAASGWMLSHRQSASVLVSISIDAVALVAAVSLRISRRL